jgi:EAL domain-containing protein (putative c-di-GMP-specific phosphodiesterase class I)
VQRHKQLESDLKLAIDDDQLHIKYEPIVDLRSGELLSLEAHLCWNHPVHGCIESAEFNLIAEECGLASELACWMLSTACGQLRHWQQEQGNVIPAALNINLTPKQFALPDLPRIASEALERFKLQPPCLQFEITESGLSDNMTEARQRIEQLRQIGVRVAIDHFGVGLSSFTSLHRLPVDSLKIDRSMLADLQYSAQAASLIHGLAVIVRNIGISLVAVGIENADQLIALQGLGCAAAQGQYFGRPMTAECVAPFLRDPANRSYYARGAAAFAVQWAERPDGPTVVDQAL